MMNEQGETIQLADDKDIGSFVGRLIAGQTELIRTLYYGIDLESISDLQLQVVDFDSALTISINGSIVKKGDIVSIHKGVLTPGYKSEPVRLSICASKAIKVADNKQHKVNFRLEYLYPGR
jgi:hypothetical protein